MQLPFFYIEASAIQGDLAQLDEDSSRHAVQVLRMKRGEPRHLTNGMGELFTASIEEDHKKHCRVRITEMLKQQRQGPSVSMAISLLKNSARFEWFLEKAVELGVERIVPLLCERTERQKFRLDRMQNICVSAMLQSRQCWLPELTEPMKFSDIASWKLSGGSNLIAHCAEGSRSSLGPQLLHPSTPQLIAIGPEGDFSAGEIELALGQGFVPVSLGSTRLRTETAGVAAASVLRLTV